MHTIHKFELTIGISNSIHSPGFIKCLKVGMQNGRLHLWAEIDTAQKKSTTTCFVYVIGTGHNIPYNMKYLDTVFDGSFVWHVYTDLVHNS